VGAHCATCVKEQRGPVAANVKRAVTVNARTTKSNLSDMPLTKLIIAVNGVVFVYTELLKSKTVTAENLGLFAPFVAKGEWYRILTSGFLHFGVFHIAMNMYILFQLGRTFEEQIGRPRFAAMYFAAMAGGSAGALLLEPYGLTGGASGAVFGLAGAAVVALKARGVPFGQTQWGPMLAINLVITFTIPGISKGGHLGGLLFGGIAGYLVLNPKRRGSKVTTDVAIICALIVIGVVASILIAKNPIVSR
jgi:membrane associated rhomboid family serine protease